jgi:hypothetical protein
MEAVSVNFSRTTLLIPVEYAPSIIKPNAGLGNMLSVSVQRSFSLQDFVQQV